MIKFSEEQLQAFRNIATSADQVQAEVARAAPMIAATFKKVREQLGGMHKNPAVRAQLEQFKRNNPL